MSTEPDSSRYGSYAADQEPEQRRSAAAPGPWLRQLDDRVGHRAHGADESSTWLRQTAHRARSSLASASVAVSLLVSTIAGDGIVGVGNCDDAGPSGFFPPSCFWLTEPSKILVVRPISRCAQRRQRRGLAQTSRATSCLPFRIERAVLVQEYFPEYHTLRCVEHRAQTISPFGSSAQWLPRSRGIRGDFL